MTPESRKLLERWLKKNYAATTVSQTMIDLGTIEKRLEESETLTAGCVFSARRIARWAREAGVELAGWNAVLAVKAPSSGLRKSTPRSFDPLEWQRLRHILEDSSLLEDHVLGLALLTGLRAGDALRIEVSSLIDVLEGPAPGLRVTVKGGKQRMLLLHPAPLRKAAERLLQSARALNNRATLAEVLVPDSRQNHPYKAAYQRLLRRLKAITESLEFGEGRVHTHRLRRTAAVAALRSGVDLDTVRQLLDHSSINTTSKYLDEDRQQDVANAMEKFHSQLEGKDQ